MGKTKMAEPPPAPAPVDDEMAALEAEAAGAMGVDASVVQKILASFRKTVGRSPYAPVKSTGPVGKPKRGADRLQRRAMERSAPDWKPDPATRNSAVGIGRGKPVKSDAQKAIEYRRAVRNTLRGIKLERLVPSCPDVKHLLGNPGLKNVWQLTQAPTGWVHAIPGLGPKRRKAIHSYLTEQGVVTVWTP